MLRGYGARHRSVFGHVDVSGWPGALGHALLRIMGALDPWPDGAKTADELLKMLMAEFPRTGQQRGPRVSFGELLERHRRLLSEPGRNLSSEEWLV